MCRKCLHPKTLTFIAPSRGFQKSFQFLNLNSRKTTLRGEPDGEWTVLRALGARAVLYRHEASCAANAKTSDPLAVGCRDRPFYCTSLQTGDRSHDPDTSYSVEY